MTGSASGFSSPSRWESAVSDPSPPTDAVPRKISVPSRLVMPIAQVETRYYLRFSVGDHPGVLGHIASALGGEGVSIEQMVQEGRAGSGGAAAAVLMITHSCREGAVQKALARIASAKFMKAPPRSLRIEAV